MEVDLDLQLQEGSNRLAIDFLVSSKGTKRELPGPRKKLSQIIFCKKRTK